MSIQDDSYIRAQALKAALELAKLKMGSEPSALTRRTFTHIDEVLATAKRFEDSIRGW